VDDSLDFDVSALDFNLDEPDSQAQPTEHAAADNSIDFDMPSSQPAEDEDSTELNLSLDSDSEIDLGSIDFETDAPAEETPTEAMSAPADMELSLEDFDNEETLHGSASDDIGSSFDEASDFADNEMPMEDLGDDDELSDDIFADVDEIGTKLDLAKAYVDMGDSDGAKSILDEVMEEGDDTQKEQAQELLRQIG
jgi:pilus assembly protein FimV